MRKEPCFMAGDPTEALQQSPQASELQFPPLMLDGPPSPEDRSKQNVWEYLVEHVDEFEVAKSIVDFVDANPKLLTDRNTPADLMGLHLLAKVSLKRQAVAYVREQEARALADKTVQKALEQSRSFTGRAKRIGSHLVAVAITVRDNPNLLTLAASVSLVFALNYWMR